MGFPDDWWFEIPETDGNEFDDPIEPFSPPIVDPFTRRRNRRRFTKRCGRYRARQDHGTRGNSLSWWYDRWASYRKEGYVHRMRRYKEVWRTQEDWQNHVDDCYDWKNYWSKGDIDEETE